ncbi:PXA domain-containing protein [Lipomyces japonicus]|uniref:PXA domain-containing protein n=1 Tax=Lipomyces japonicus TaxID=56871 RepID=UPI0034CD6396
MSNSRRHGTSTSVNGNLSNDTATGKPIDSEKTGKINNNDVNYKKIEKSVITETLIRNTLVPSAALRKPLEEALPALTSFADIDIELYALLSLILRQFVQAWYSAVTGDEVVDKTFVYEVVHVIAHVTTSLEGRLRKVDPELLLLDDIPFVLDAHLRDYKLARQKVGTAYAAGQSFEQMFHALQPHPALVPPADAKLGDKSVSATENSNDYDDMEHKFLAVLSKGILAVLLPSEDLGSSVERALLKTLLADVVLWKAIDKLSEPFMIHEIISKVIEKSLSGKDREENQDGSTLSAESSIVPFTFITLITEIFRLIVRFISFFQAGIVFLISFANSSEPSSLSHKQTNNSSAPHYNSTSSSLLTIALFPTVVRLLNLQSRQPWLMATIELLTLPLVSLPPGSLVDRLLSHFFRKYVLTSQFACSVLVISRQTLFPNNGPMAPPRIYPSVEEKQQILKQVQKNILRAIPVKIRKQVLGDDAIRGVEELLSPFDNKFANKHLLFFLVDMIIIKILPELAEQTPEELKVWRLGE